jgi:hypothetical protein
MTSEDRLLLPPSLDEIERKLDHMLEELRTPRPSAFRYAGAIAATTGNTFKGSPIEVADQMEDWYTSRACDDFIVANPVMPRSLKAFVELVVPELQRRKLFRMAYPGDTLRETMGLPIPINRHFEARRSNEYRPDRARHAFSGGAA